MEHQEDLLLQIGSGLQDAVRPVQQELNRRQRLVDFIQECLRAVGRNDFIHLDELLRSALVAQVTAEADLAGTIEFFEKLRTRAEQEVERYRLEFIEALKTQAEAAGLPLIIDFPRFSLLKGIDGEIDFAGRKTTINGRPLKSIDPKRIVPALRRLKQQLYDQPFDPRAFIEHLFGTYNEMLQKEQLPLGNAVPMQRFYFEYVISLQSKPFLLDMDKGKFRGYAIDQFAVDLWRYFQAGTGGTSNGFGLQLRPGRNRALWLIDSDGERRQITAISFQKNV
jgi:hypothetical protein